MTSFELRVLGELGIWIDGQRQRLPRSRKTRALLAYLAITGRTHRREQLSELFWDVTDDRRAALRWSLSKLRKTLGPEHDHRVAATREQASFELTPQECDLTRLRAAARQGFDTRSVDELEGLVSGWNGELLEGLLLPDFDGFEAWLEAERSEARALHHKVCRVLVERLKDDPARAFVHARAWARAGGGNEASQWFARLEPRLGEAKPTAMQETVLEVTPSPPTLLAPTLVAPTPAIRGRDRELARLARLVRATRQEGRGHIVLVVGEPGMGKTRLVEELRYRERDSAALLEVDFDEVERERPLGPFLDALSQANALADGVPSDREQLFESASGWLRRQANERGLALLLLEDAHLADPSSCELLHFVVRTASRLPSLTVLTCRPAELEDNEALVRALVSLRRRHPIEEIRLGPLGEADIAALARDMGSDRPLERLVELSAGVPLMALELAQHTAQTGSLPPTLADLVNARLATLPTATQELVAWAAVLERGSLELLARTFGSSGTDFTAALERATRYQLIRLPESASGRGTFRIAHALVGRIIYENISQVRRAAMHRTIAEAMSEGDPAHDLSSSIAHHATQADRPDLAAHALIRGGERAAAMGASSQAVALARRALEFVGELRPADALPLEVDASCLLLQLVRPEDPSHWVDRLTALGLEALDQARPQVASRAFQAAGRLRWETGDSHASYGIARQAWRASSGGSAAHRVRGSSMVALCLVLMEKDLPEALAMVHQAEALAHGEEPSDLVLARGLLHLHAGRLEDARRDAEDARTIARLERFGVREATALQLWMQTELCAGHTGRARELARALIEVADRIREGSEAWVGRAVLALTEPSIEAVRAGLLPVVERMRVLDDKRARAWVDVRWARRERLAGELCQAKLLAQRALETATIVASHSEAALAACEIMAAATQDDRDGDYAAAEDTLATLETEASLSREARDFIRETTTTTGAFVPAAEPSTELS